MVKILQKMSKENPSLSISNPHPEGSHWAEKLSVSIGVIGLLILSAALMGASFSSKGGALAIALVSLTIAPVIYAYGKYKNTSPGIKNNGVWHSGLSSRGVLAWALGILLTAFYVVLYWFPSLLGLGDTAKGITNSGIVSLFDPLSRALSGHPASQWFVYGTFYTVAILGLGTKFIYKYRHNKYQMLRTISVMFFQLGFAFLIPEILQGLNQPYYNFANMWPLNYYFFDGWHIDQMMTTSQISVFMFSFGLAMIFLISPFLTYKYGKRWYCSWVCGCGGLAETAGDSFRQLSSKKMSAWKFERWSIHLVMVFSFIMTVAVISTYLSDKAGETFISRTQFIYSVIAFLIVFAGGLVFFKRKSLNKDVRYALISVSVVIIILLVVNMFSGGGNNIFFADSYALRKWYGFGIGSVFSGVIGVGFYPILGSRVWCRFGCPMAGILGLQQKFFSRFRITTNGSQCISCGNCSTYCEMGIDVRSYAQKGQNIVRASCVGCGVCSAVCPRGVLKLENGKIDLDQRTSELRNIHIK